MAAEDDRLEAVRALLESALEGVLSGRRLAEVGASSVDAQRAASLLGPPARAKATIDWIAVNGQRVDAVLTAGELQWRVIFGSENGVTIDWLDVHQRPERFDGVMGGRAVVVNGPSGAGKSTLLVALQQVATVPFVVFDEPEHLGTVQPAYLIWRQQAPALHRGYIEAIGALARSGNYVAVSAAGHAQSEFLDAFSDVPVLSVGLSCDPEVLTRREGRTGRWGGIATASLDLHDGWSYDVEFDTTDGPDAGQMARQILDRL